jgi:hypothetical protein
MADLFYAALYVVLAKGVGHATVEVAWGSWFFTARGLVSFAPPEAAVRVKV